MVRRVLALRTGQLALALLSLIALLAILGPILAPYDPLASTSMPLAGPSAQHWLGTDYLGRDVFSRLLAGSRASVVGSVEVALVALVVGVIPGLLSVYLGRVFEWLSLRLADTLITLPFLVFAVAVTALLGNGITQAMVVVGVLVSPLFFRVSRAATLSVARAQYVESALISGASVGWIVRRHVWVKVLPAIAIAMAQTMGVGFIVVSSLSFLGIGVQPPAPTWGGAARLGSQLSALPALRPGGPRAGDHGDGVGLQHARRCHPRCLRRARARTGEQPEGPHQQKRRPAPTRGKQPLMTTLSELEAPASRPIEAAASDQVVLSVRDVRIHDQVNDREIVHGISFELTPGKVVGIVGESGSGKTLTCRAALGILPEHFAVSGGSIEVAGHDIAQLSPAQWTALRGSTISAVFQDPASYLNPSIRVGAQIAEVIRVKTGATRRQARHRAMELLAAVQLRNPALVYEQYTFELSGGMLQRVLIAAAIAADPTVLIADEATTALDVNVQAEILDLLADLQERTGLALLVVSHDLAVVAQLCDEVLVMRDGNVLEQGLTADVLHHPEHEYTQMLIAEHEQYGLERYLDAEFADRVGGSHAS